MEFVFKIEKKQPLVFDWLLAFAVGVILTLGLLNLFSASQVAGAPAGLFTKQVVWVAIGVVVFAIFAGLDYRRYTCLAAVAYVAAIALLALVLVIGTANIKGAHRWFALGGMHLQPSELAKLGVVLLFAQLTATDPERLVGFGLPRMGALFVLLIAPVGLIAVQPDLGTAFVVGIIGFSMMMFYRAGWFAKLPIIMIAVMAVAMRLAMGDFHGYQRARLLSFLDPLADPRGAGYQANQAMLAVGSGRFAGRGWMAGIQGRTGHLPESWTDFPFAVWAEEWGFRGGLVLIAAYLFLVLWALRVSRQSSDRLGAMLAFGVACLIFFQATINIAMVTGALPVVGVTLPLFSYGGSSMLVTMAALGVLMSVSIRRHQQPES